MRIENLSKATGLAGEIERLERHSAAFRQATEVRVSLTYTPALRRPHEAVVTHQCELTDAEVRDAVVAALSRRLGAKRAELAALGVDMPEPAPSTGDSRRAKPV